MDGRGERDRRCHGYSRKISPPVECDNGTPVVESSAKIARSPDTRVDDDDSYVYLCGTIEFSAGISDPRTARRQLIKPGRVFYSAVSFVLPSIPRPKRFNPICRATVSTHTHILPLYRYTDPPRPFFV